jgi:hypothetical protein
MTRQKRQPRSESTWREDDEVKFFACTSLKIFFGEKFCNTYVGGVAPRLHTHFKGHGTYISTWVLALGFDPMMFSM